mmetsp:Transcript_14045/g.20998  ORF Transcript_14045/g.20998 Transcript_14045/m.20998 type:complete len:747 (-) Transcript_14045:29-2269(-)
MSAPKFSELTPALSLSALNAIQSFGFEQATPVQAAVIPLFMAHKDVCVQATTGSGKTLAFGVPLFEILQRRVDPFRKYEIGALVIAPTRELATQIYRVLAQVSDHYSNLQCVLFIGGTDVEDSSSSFERKGAQVVVGTPGRVLDTMNRSKSLILKELEVLVLDEADTLLDMGFRQTINQILSMLPKQRRTGLFSATQTQELRELAVAGMRNPVTVSVSVKHSNQDSQISSSRSIPTTLKSYFTVSPYDQRLDSLATFLQKNRGDKIIVFVSTCACVDFFTLALNRLMKEKNEDAEDVVVDGAPNLTFSRKMFIPDDMLVVGLHGKMVPKKRQALYSKFVAHTSSGGVMFCTDVAARGIDIPDVDWIVQLTAPKDPSFFVHRVGRTARAGRQGAALIFISEEERPYAELLRGRGVPMDELDLEDLQALTLDKSLNEPDATGGSDIDEGESAKYSILNDIKYLAAHDRELLEAGTTAFISFLRAYKEHLCSYIFRIDQLDIGAVARSYSLLKLPKIAETIKFKSKIDFQESGVNTSTIPYKHKEKEKARRKRQEELLSAKETDSKVDIAEVKYTGEKRPREDNRAKKEATVIGKDDEKRKRKKKEGLHKRIMTEWEELAAESTMYKKFKKGKISKEVYDDALTGDDVLEIDQVVALGQPSRSRYSSDEDDSDSDGVDNRASSASQVKSSKALRTNKTSKKKPNISSRPTSKPISRPPSRPQSKSYSSKGMHASGKRSFGGSRRRKGHK